MNNIYSEIFDAKSSLNSFFSIDSYEKVLDYLNIDKNDFIDYWQSTQTESIKYFSTIPFVSLDWIWGFYLPLITYIRNYLNQEKKPLIIGISGLPGSGKSTASKNLEEISKLMNISLKVISLDDFYLPSPQLDHSMKGNPWNVPRGLPGSHSISEISNTINTFLNKGILSAPQFDKSLRDGLGDRSGWIETRANVLILEGWFLGCKPFDVDNSELFNLEENLNPALNKKEIDYRYLVQKSLENYLPIWDNLLRIWHLKADSFNNTVNWKSEQEQNLRTKKGSSLQGDQLTSFVRMIKASIPQRSLQNIDSDVILKINKDRKIISVESPRIH